MSHYRVYRLDPKGSIVSGDWIEAANEDSARKVAASMCDETTPTVELWQAARRVAVVPCDAGANNESGD